MIYNTVIHTLLYYAWYFGCCPYWFLCFVGYFEQKYWCVVDFAEDKLYVYIEGWKLIQLAQSLLTFTFTFSHLADAFVQSDVQGREYSSYEQ